MTASGVLLEVQGLSVRFRRADGAHVHALDNVTFDLAAGETLALVGESGSGKSVTALALAGLLEPSAEILGGSVRLRGRELLGAGEPALRCVRGSQIALIFQNPRRSLNPIRRVGDQIADALQARRPRPARQAHAQAIEALAQVGIADPAARARAYPWQLSGGMCQRVMIALALSGEPALLVADEPTTGLDVTTQAAVMTLIAAQARARRMATLLITHDLALASEYCDRVAVMHAGHLVEVAPVRRLFEAPAHPYTQHLIDATPRRGLSLQGLRPVPGELPDLARDDLPACRFAERCERRIDGDCDRPPPVTRLADGHQSACWNPL
ncbi:ABC transporter ATP-binding protein [Variovorax sp. J22P271]|uniref:ABC transporter ATP-binding protein n=1 Tax=Variovorax davisae TaxID=3053515 RepID=UPI00257859E2|nr:ABC transporter ATP-binding protein [Variovorax sp. J22P271]MDM0035158.1 ABC transporter ATP-binding protein [Variovorax sp. J22P271]